MILNSVSGITGEDHYHTSHVVFYVLEGAGVWQEDGKEPVTLKPGALYFGGDIA